MDFAVLGAVALIWIFAAITPGPNFFITVHTALSTTPRFSLYTVFGIVVGTLVWALSGCLGITLLFKTVPFLYLVLKIIGGVYLVYVGFNLIVKKTKQPLTRGRGTFNSAGRCFRLGLLTNLLNPKTAAFMTSLFAATFPPDASLALGVICVLLICSISASWYALVSVIFSYDGAKRAYDNHKRTIEKMAGALFVGFGLKLALFK